MYKLKSILKPSNFLLNLSLERMKISNPRLYKARSIGRKDLWIERLTTAGAFKYIAGLLCCLTLIPVLDYYLFNGLFGSIFNFIAIDDTLCDKILDQRISNVATITSISLVVVGWLINNIKEKTRETYDLLFLETKLFPIVFYILFVILLLIALSTLRNSLEKALYYNFVLLGVYYIVFAILFICYLFTKLILFTDPQQMYRLSTKGLVNTTLKVLYREKLMSISKEILNERLGNFGQIINNTYMAGFSKNIYVDVKSKKIIRDLDLIALERCIPNLIPPDTHHNIEFWPISLLEEVGPENPRVFMVVSERVVQVSALKSAVADYVYVDSHEKYANFESVRISLNEKAELAIRQNDIKALRQVLNDYETIYALYFNNI